MSRPRRVVRSTRRRGLVRRLRKATLSDRKVLVDHRRAMFSEIGGRTGRQLADHDRVYRRWLLPRIRSGEVMALFVADGGDRVLASGAVWFRPEQPRPGAPLSTVPYLFSMYTEPGFRRQGLARRIVREFVRVARARGYARVVLHAAPRGRPLYRGLGFERTWEMRLDLRPR